MNTIKIGEKEYVLEFTFEAVEHKNLVQSMFNIMSGAYIVKTEENGVTAMIDGVSAMVADIPHICKIAFYAGLLEHNPVSEEEAKTLMKEYMKENKLSYSKLFEDLKGYMEDDGFFDLSGLNDMLQTMQESAEQTKKQPKTPQDHKKKSTSTK